MEKLPIVLARDYWPTSLCIMLFTMSRWSHCGIVDGDYVIDTQLMTGCIRTPLEEWKKKHKVWEFRELVCKNREEGIEFARNQIGSKYDWMGIIGLAVRRRMQKADKFFCSELVTEAAQIYSSKTTYRTCPGKIAYITTLFSSPSVL